MDVEEALPVLDAYRIAEQARARRAAALRSRDRAHAGRAAAAGAVTTCRRAVSEAVDSPARSAATDALEAARAVLELAADTVRKAEGRVRRSYLAVRAANRVLGARYRPLARGRDTGGLPRSKVAAGLLEELASMPAELLRAAHVVAVQSSGGKDSVVMLHRVVTWARHAGILHKVVVVHADLGEDSEWPGVVALARRQAERYGLRFITVKAEDKNAEPDDDGERPPLGLLGLVRARGMWPDALRRLCTATVKRAPADALVTALVNELGLDDQAVVLVCMGIRAQESADRAKKDDLLLNVRTSSGNRLILVWHPIFRATETDIWQEIADNALEYHEVYDALLPRLSCVFCVLAGWDALVRAARICFRLGLDHPRQFREVEAEIEHRFKNDFTIAEVIAEAERLDAAEGTLTWQRGDAIASRFGQDAAADYLARLALVA